MRRGFCFDEAYDDPRCDFCGQGYQSLGVQVSFAGAIYEICPSCLLKGPRVVALETAQRPKEEFHSQIRRWFMKVKAFAKGFEDLSDFRDLPGGVMAAAIASAYRELDNRPKGAKGKAA